MIPLTCGVVPNTLNSKVFGRVNVYDFAGHKHYYASHEIILQQTTQPLVLIAINISLSWAEIDIQLVYWLSLLSSCSKSRTIHVLVIGSHADKMKTKAIRKMEQNVSNKVSTESTVKCHGFIHCDCRYPASIQLNEIREKISSICRSIRLFIAHHESSFSTRLCASLMRHLQQSSSK